MGSAGIEGVIMQERSVNRGYSTIRSALPLRGNIRSSPFHTNVTVRDFFTLATCYPQRNLLTIRISRHERRQEEDGLSSMHGALELLSVTNNPSAGMEPRVSTYRASGLFEMIELDKANGPDLLLLFESVQDLAELDSIFHTAIRS